MVLHMLIKYTIETIILFIIIAATIEITEIIDLKKNKI